MLVKCTIKDPIHHYVETPGTAGCSSIDIRLTEDVKQIDEISFKNNYTASASIFYQKRGLDDEENAKWIPVFRLIVLMPYAHLETNAQRLFTLTSDQFETPVVDARRIVFIIRQPSHLWKQFGLADIQLHNRQNAEKLPLLPHWLKRDAAKEEQLARVAQDSADWAGISERLQNLLTLANYRRTMEPPTNNLGRFDIDDNYEINLLVYK